MVPTPSESEKKLCPMAAATADGVILLKSGFSMYDTPGAEPGSVREYTMITTISTNNSGIEILLKRSIPAFTPADTIQAQPPRKSV